jgi:hypothetical protein
VIHDYSGASVRHADGPYVLPYYVEEIMPAQLHNDVRIDDVILDTVE